MLNAVVPLIIIYILGICTGMIIILGIILEEKRKALDKSIANLDTIVKSWSKRDN